MFGIFNLKVVFPSPYEREVWHFKKANVDRMRKAINGFHEKNHFKIQTSMTYFIYLTELSKTYYVISFHNNQSHMMMEIHLGLIIQ